QYDFLRDIGQTIFTIALQADGKILTGESLQSVYNNNERYPRIDFYRASKDFRINRYQSNGSRDHDFCINSTQTGANRTVYASAQQADGKMLIGGNFFSYNGTAANYIARIDSDGSRDLSFNAGGSGPDSRVNAIAVQPDGKILIGGMFKFYNGIPVNQLVRLLPDGSLDNSFNYPTAMGIGRVTKILLQPDGKILVSWFVGSSSLAVQRLNPDGSRDAGFNASIPASYLQSYVFIHSIALQPDGKILVGGSFGASMSGLSGYRNLTRLETNGTRDLSFNPTAPQTQVGPTADVYDIRILPDGKIMLVGGFQGYNASGTVVPAAGIIRLLSTGIPDAGFNASGSGIVGTATTLSVLPDTRMLVGGLIQSYNHTPVNNLVCIQADGNIDGLFNAGESGASDAVWTIAQSPTGTHTLIGGAFTRYNDQGKNRLARISLGCSGFYQSDTVFICSSQLPYTWHNQSYAAPGTYTTTLVSASGCDSIRTLFLQVTAGVLEGPSKICGLIATGNTADYRMAAPPGTLFTWSVTQPTNMTILSGAGTNHIQVRFEPGFTNGVVYVRATNPSCGINLNRYLSISRTIPATPSGIQSSAGSICAYIGTSNTVVYSIARIASATAYNWTTGTGTIVTHPNGTGINDTIITVRFLINFATSPITVQAVNECGVSETRSVTIRRDPPALPGLISGTTNVCNNLLTPFISGGPAPHGSYTDYAVPYVPDVRYIWNLPTPYVYGNGSNYISAGFESGFSSGTISVQATNGCGSSASRSITVRTVTASAPGSISTVNAGSCPLRRFIYSVASLPMNADSIQWSVPGGGIIESGQGTTSISVVYPSGTILGYVTAQGTNHCSISSLRKIHINLPACPTSLWTFHTDPAATMFDKTSVRANSKSRMLVYPNPSVADFTAEYTGTGAAQVSLVVMDAMGKIIGKYWVNAGQSLRFGANLTPGIYFIETREANELHTTRLVKL
ncbi:MAG TPA: T9SS type A sorting domain-containing protein, partial [Ferruginibacter sp.]|nr:T9SS type A sorting domain-containing protein [Ferruginibacter sp.]